MTQREKLSAMIRQNPKAVHFDDAYKVAGWLGFIHEDGQGSHRVFKRPGEPLQLNFQNCKGVVPSYQALQLIAMLDMESNAMQHYLVEIFWSHEDQGYIATVPDLPGCCAWGTTEFEALHEIQDAIAAWINTCRESGEPVPRPTAKARQAA